MPIRIVLADDHQVVRKGLRMVLDAEDGLEVIAEAGDVVSVARKVLAHTPDVLVLDLNMAGESSLASIPVLREHHPDTAIVALTMQDDPAFAREALTASAIGYVPKEAADTELVQAVRSAAVGRTYLGPELGARLATAEPAAGGPPDALSPPRARGVTSDRARPHEFRNRRPALHRCPNGRDAPRPDPAQNRAQQPSRPGRLRPGVRVD